ncbi:glycosyltransferase family 4 protein [Caenispirillum salinarum]|uniref:glycosyltransferase family 4 protein n=1 Tax=Caenispirillum salinarum TaxID=859058 RepID=UPI0005BCFC6A|nr:glycosyltransferase family 4 protein [Caenispirillum salinarum]
MTDATATDRPLRVLLWHWGRRGGGPRYTLELARALSQRDDVAVYLSLSRQAEIANEYRALEAEDSWFVDTYENLWQFGLRSLFLPVLRRRFLRYIRDNRIDVVLCTMDHLWNAFIVGGVRSTGASYMLTVHDAVRHPGEERWPRNQLLAQDIKAADGVLTLTESVRGLLNERHGFPRRRTWVAPHGVFSYGHPAEPRRLPADRPPRLLFFGRILPYKGLDVFLQAVAALHERGLKVDVEIWGSGSMEGLCHLLPEAECLRLENRWIAEEEIPEILRRSDICVLPYREASQSGVLPTVFAAGIPAVLTPVAGLREQATEGHNALFAPAINAEAVAETLYRLIQDPELYQRLSAGAVQTATEDYDWKAIAQTVSEALYDLVELGERSPNDTGSRGLKRVRH